MEKIEDYNEEVFLFTQYCNSCNKRETINFYKTLVSFVEYIFDTCHVGHVAYNKTLRHETEVIRKWHETIIFSDKETNLHKNQTYFIFTMWDLEKLINILSDLKYIIYEKITHQNN